MKKQISVLLLILVLCVCLFAGMAKADVIEIEEYWEEFFYTHHEDCETVNTYYTVNTKGGETKVREDASRLSKTLLEIPNGEEVFIKFIYHVPNGSDWGFWLDDRVMGEYHTEALWILMSDLYDPENPPEDLVIYEQKGSTVTDESSTAESSDEEESSQITEPGSGNGITLAIVISAVVLVMLISVLVLVLIKDH
ncbi:MAG: hypothetical protein J5589_05170 [Firmicutes bacterium]|nr:hypothetical protein [Bacillota bacterium]